MSCCKPCYKVCDKIPDCIGTLIIPTNQLSKDMQVSIIDKFGHIFSEAVTTDETGKASINLNDPDKFPVALLNRYAGEFMIQVNDTTTGNLIPFNIEGVEYDCIKISSTLITPSVSTYTIKL